MYELNEKLNEKSENNINQKKKTDNSLTKCYHSAILVLSG